MNEGRQTRRRAHRRRRQIGSLLFVALVVVTLGGVAFFGLVSETRGDEVSNAEQAVDPGVAGTPETSAEEQATTEETSAGEEKTAGDQQATDQQATDEGAAPTKEEATPPADPTMYLSIPKLGINGVAVVGGEGGLEVGTEHVPGTGYPWVSGSNTYIAGHRLGFPGTGSDHIFFNLPSLAPGDEISLTDSNGKSYTYRVSETLQVDPMDLSVTAPTGSDVISLQTCIENYGDFATLGPDWNVRFIIRGTRV